jgi:hypothetical protein
VSGHADIDPLPRPDASALRPYLYLGIKGHPAKISFFHQLGDHGNTSPFYELNILSVTANFHRRQ